MLKEKRIYFHVKNQELQKDLTTIINGEDVKAIYTTTISSISEEDPRKLHSPSL